MTSLVWAFVWGGAICAVAQAAWKRFRLTPPAVFALCMVLGVIFAACGWIGSWVAQGQAGVILMVLDCGEVMQLSWQRAVQGDAARMLQFFRDMVCIFGIAVLCGLFPCRKR